MYKERNSFQSARNFRVEFPFSATHFYYIECCLVSRTSHDIYICLGKKIAQKLIEVRAVLKEFTADSLIVTSLEDVACT